VEKKVLPEVGAEAAHVSSRQKVSHLGKAFPFLVLKRLFLANSGQLCLTKRILKNFLVGFDVYKIYSMCSIVARIVQEQYLKRILKNAEYC
jgi:hypothetical protein